MRHENGVPTYLVVVGHEDVVVEVDEDAVIDEIFKYITEMCSGLDGYQLLRRHAVEVFYLWRATTAPIPRPKAVRWQGETGLTYRRLPWEMRGGITPVFAELLARCSNRDALIAWIGSLLIEKADRQQYVWLHGKGLDGKSALARFLAKAFGPAAVSLTVPGHNGDKFWTSKLINKRFCYFPDCKKYGFPATGEFKSLTGGDRIGIEPKHKAAYDAELVAKFLFLSNEKPALSSERADMRRVIYSEVQAVPVEADPSYDEKLWEEGGAFLTNCVTYYAQTYPAFGAIKASTTEVTDWVASLEETYQLVLETYFELEGEPRGKGAEMGKYTQQQKTSWASGVQLEERMQHARLDRARAISFRNWLERRHGIRRKAIDISGNDKRYNMLIPKPLPLRPVYEGAKQAPDSSPDTSQDRYPDR